MAPLICRVTCAFLLLVSGLASMACSGDAAFHAGALPPVPPTQTQPSGSGVFRALPDQATLVIGGVAHKPLRVRAPWSPEFFVGGRRFSVEDVRVIEVDSNGQPLWSVTSPDGHRLRVLAAGGRMAFFQSLPTDEREPGEAIRLHVQRLDLQTHAWLAPLVLPPGDVEKDSSTIVSVLASDTQVVTLTALVRVDPKTREKAPYSYEISCFKHERTVPEWTRVFRANGSRQEPGVYLWAARMPDYAGSDIQHLTRLEDRILLCAGEKEDLVLLDASGKTVWQVPRLWEFRRDFIGPSMWTHVIERETGNKPSDDFPTTQKAPATTEAATQPAERFECAIVGGPYVVPAGEKHPARLFVAVARGPNAWNWGYLSDCLVYELDMRGTVVAIGSLPRMVRGNVFRPGPGSLVVACQHEGMARLVPSAGGGWGGPGGADLVCNVTWYREHAGVDVDAWLTADKAVDAIALGPTLAFRTVAGGHVLRREDQVYVFPIAVIDLKSGVDRTIELRVPFSGTLPKPTTNFWSLKSKIGVRGPYKLGITSLRADGDTLRVVVATESSSAELAFDVSSLEVLWRGK